MRGVYPPPARQGGVVNAAAMRRVGPDACFFVERGEPLVKRTYENAAGAFEDGLCTRGEAKKKGLGGSWKFATTCGR